MQDKSTYIIHGGQSGADRLRILANAMWPYTEPFLQRAGLKTGMNCLDVGCGNGEMTKRIAEMIGPEGQITGIDFDPSVISIAEQNNVEKGNVIFKVNDIENDDLSGTSFDFIFCRFIISHLQSPEVVLQKLLDALQPGGILAIEDVDFQGHFSHPHNHAFNTYVRWYEKVSIRKGANPLIGPFLLRMLTDLGMKDVDMKVVLPAFHKGDGKLMAILTLKAIRNTIISEGIAREEEVDDVIHSLQTYTDDKMSIISLPRIFQVSGIL